MYRDDNGEYVEPLCARGLQGLAPAHSFKPPVNQLPLN